MKILFVTGEAVPFVKTGGLGDVAGSMPKELGKTGLDVRLIMPKYGSIPESFRERMQVLDRSRISLGFRDHYCGLETVEEGGIIYYFIDNEDLFQRPGIYGFWDDGERFAFFCRAVLDSLPATGFQPDVIHCHDWHTAMVSLLLNTKYRENPFYRDARTIITIHNLKYQGIFPREILSLFPLDEKHFNMEELEFYGHTNFLKGGLAHADAITTVSKTYGEEILTPPFGENLDGFLRTKQRKLLGIINGIDYEVYNPRTDPVIYCNFHRYNLAGKAENKHCLRKELGLPVVDPRLPLVTMVTRLTGQKGLDLVAGCFEETMKLPLQMVVLGSGDQQYENFFREMKGRYREKLAVHLGFDDGLARKIYAGGDIFLMPSLFEPCGISQMIALRYGNVPLVRETGGLSDTVFSYREDTGEGNGFSFAPYHEEDLLFTLKRALNFYQKKEIWETIVRRGMEMDFSWTLPVREYRNLYLKLLSGRK